MERNLLLDFQVFSDRVLQYHSHFVSLVSGVVIGMITNYLITYVFPLPYWYGLILCIFLLAFSSYVFMLYSPQIIRGQAVETIPKTLHEFLHHSFDKLLLYIKLDLEGYAFPKKSGVRVETSQVSSHQGDVNLEYPFLRCLKCRITLHIFIISLRVKLRNAIIGIEMNRLVRLHPKSDQVLRTLGINVRHAIFNPQLIDPNLSDEEFLKILKEIRPYMLQE